jgi:two-component system, cell cycle sensor histidine kinase and response regulator CckA
VTKRLLLVDEEKYAMGYYEDALGASGYDVVFCDDADKCLETVETQGPFDGVVLDLLMPSLVYRQENRYTGELLLEELRKTHPLLKVVILTNVGDANLLKTLQAQPHTTVLRKDSTVPADLVSHVKSVIGS